jgi:hypothetical protein
MRPTFVKVCAWIYAFLGYTVTVGTHFHYSVDVFLATLLSLLLWMGYHTYIRTMWDAREKACNVFLLWAEKDAVDLDFYRARADRDYDEEGGGGDGCVGERGDGCDGREGATDEKRTPLLSEGAPVMLATDALDVNPIA